jgi:hypothetical protein
MSKLLVQYSAEEVKQILVDHTQKLFPDQEWQVDADHVVLEGGCTGAQILIKQNVALPTQKQKQMLIEKKID